MSTTTLHLDAERAKLIAWTAIVFALLAMFGLAAETFWTTQPLALLVLTSLFAGTLVLLVSISDWATDRADRASPIPRGW